MNLAVRYGAAAQNQSHKEFDWPGGDPCRRTPLLNLSMQALQGTRTSDEPSERGHVIAPRRVLVIDDDPTFVLLAGEILLQAGFEVVTASSGQEALAAFEASKPDLVLLYVELRGISGFDLCKALRTLLAGVEVPIVMVTGHDDTASVARAYEAGATDFIHKPVLWATLPHRIGFILRAQDNLRALQLSEQRNRALLQGLPDTIYIVDRQGTVIQHITGEDQRNSASQVGKQLDEVLPMDVARAAHCCRMWRVASNRVPGPPN